MPAPTAPIAVSVRDDGVFVARFGHDHSLLAINANGNGTLREAAGCCGSLAQAVADCRVVICTAIGQGAAGHLTQAGVPVALVAEGTTLADALARYRTGTLAFGATPSACDHGHGHDHAHHHENHHAQGGGCGCH